MDEVSGATVYMRSGDRRLKKLKRLGGQAIGRYSMIDDGQTIAVGVSGGKDSLLLIWFLSDLRRRAPVSFKLGAVHLGSGSDMLRAWLGSLGLDFLHYEPAPDVPELAGYIPGDASPCFVCARARRNRLFEVCRQYDVSRLALGHHLDDAIETFLMNAFFSGRLDGLAPRQDLFNGRLAIIRPLFLVPESLVLSLASSLMLPVMASSCPADGHTARQEVKELVANMSKRNPKVYGNLSAAAEDAAELALTAGKASKEM